MLFTVATYHGTLAAAQVSEGGGWVNPHSTTLPSFLFTQKVLNAVGDLE